LSNLGIYQFANPGILYLLILLYTFHFNLKAYCSELFVTNFIIFVLVRFRASLLAVNHLLIGERNMFVIVQKSSTFFLEIMTLVSSTNIESSNKVFIVGGSHLCILCKARALELTLGEL
jgi:hypothetical protein